jgi:hypothetical protein
MATNTLYFRYGLFFEGGDSIVTEWADDGRSGKFKIDIEFTTGTTTKIKSATTGKANVSIKIDNLNKAKLPYANTDVLSVTDIEWSVSGTASAADAMSSTKAVISVYKEGFSKPVWGPKKTDLYFDRKWSGSGDYHVVPIVIKATSKISKSDNGVPNKVNVRIKRKSVVLLFWMDEDKVGRKMFEAAAKTRARNKEAKDPSAHIYVIGIKSASQIAQEVESVINSLGGKSAACIIEVGVFSHCGKDGPISYFTANTPPLSSTETYQMSMEGWAAIDYNWSTSADCLFVIYGCNGASFLTNGATFVQRLSSQKNLNGVLVIGHPDFSYPSYSPRVRVTTAIRSFAYDSHGDDTWYKQSFDHSSGWNVGGTYMVASAKGLGIESISLVGDLKSRAPVKPMKAYRNGVFVSEIDQGGFNHE